jgi:heme A synthase
MCRNAQFNREISNLAFFTVIITLDVSNTRLLAITTFTAISGLWIASRRARISTISRFATTALMGAALMQVTLGITTLLYLVPVPLAAAHQVKRDLNPGW